ncbi:MAG: hypothetical protein D6809_01190 [Gammaproteobacteria bacterium]|nr:MAG: hypothetical protein D6809_01190 [Gammaproteobacteria bacterium]
MGPWGPWRAAALSLAAALALSLAAGARAAPPAPASSVPVPSSPGPGPAFLGVLQAYLERRPVAALPALDRVRAARWRRSWLDALARRWGPPVGYKAALTSPAAQRRFRASGPVWGALFRPMLRPGPEARVGLEEGVRLLVEPDLLVRVRDPRALARARSPEDLAAALDAVLPFVELPDLLFAPGLPLSGPLIAATGAGARLGVVGRPVPLTGSGAQRAARLRAIRVRLEDGAGRVLARGDARALMGPPGAGQGLGGDPLRAVGWLRDALAAEGISLERGQLLSLGSLAPPRPARPGLYRAVYTGLDPSGPRILTLRLRP